MPTYSRKRKLAALSPSPDENPSPVRPGPPTPKSMPTEAHTAHRLATPTPTPTPNPQRKPKRKPLTQTTLTLGQPTSTTCPTCNLFFSHMPRDTAAHARHHAAWAARTHVPASLAAGHVHAPAVPRTRTPRRRHRTAAAAADLDDGDAILAVRADAPAPARAFAASMLALAEGELGAVRTHRLWEWDARRGGGAGAPKSKGKGALPTPPGSSSPMRGGDEDENDGDTDKDQDRNGKEGKGGWRAVFLYVQGRACVGVLLAEGIERARRVVGGAGGAADVVLEAEERDAEVGVSRIWVARAQRGLGIASALLDGMLGAAGAAGEERVGKERVAFSAPTDSGVRLARRWAGGDMWMVYGEEDVS